MSTELCFCVWYFLSSRKTILGASSRGYVLGGDDHDKEFVLSELARTDHITQTMRPLAQRVRTQFPQGVPYEAVSDYGIEEIFAEEFARSMQVLPPSFPVPTDKLFFAQPMFDFGSGFVACEIGDNHIKQRR